MGDGDVRTDTHDCAGHSTRGGAEPKAFKWVDQALWHFLLQLNGQFEGWATDETFNMSGKTAILVFNRGIETSIVISGIDRIAKAANFKRVASWPHESGFCCAFQNTEDVSRELIRIGVPRSDVVCALFARGCNACRTMDRELRYELI